MYGHMFWFALFLFSSCARSSNSDFIQNDSLSLLDPTSPSNQTLSRMFHMDDEATLEALVLSSSPPKTIFTQTAHTCRLSSQGVASCWGKNRYGELGGGFRSDHFYPPIQVQMPEGVQLKELTTADSHTCGLTRTGTVYCWGKNLYGQLGINLRQTQLTPVPIQMPERIRFLTIGAGVYHTCGLSQNGDAFCWGRNSDGQLGNGSRENRIIPVRVSMPRNIQFKSLSFGAYFVCGLSLQGKVYCWGSNFVGQLGDGSQVDRLTPTPVQMNENLIFESITSGGLHTCGLTALGQAYCWGNNPAGQLGDSTERNSFSPVSVYQPDGLQFRSIFAGDAFTCGISRNDEVFCWGENDDGQLGIGSRQSLSTPARVAFHTGTRISEIATGAFHACGIANDSQLYCWGYNWYGQLGTDSFTHQNTPFRLAIFE
jgi:alpha-tubulin suppressor-like RCC1 family protein